MKLYCVIAILILASCTHREKKPIFQKPINSKDTSLSLKDTLGTILLTIPNRYDTFLVWTHHSDCSSCGSEKYRFQPKSLPIYLESGWLWYDRKDSIDQFTIEHPQYRGVRDSLGKVNTIELHGKMVADSELDPLLVHNINFFDTIETINGREFSVITSANYDGSSKLYSRAVLGTTFIRGVIIKFSFNLITNKMDSITDNFIENSKALLYQIRANGL